MNIEQAARLISDGSTFNSRFPNAPLSMAGPALLAPGEAWTHRCPVIMTGPDRGGVVRTLPCAITTQGGRAGLRAHQQVVHGIS